MGNRDEGIQEEAIVVYSSFRCPTVGIMGEAVGKRVESPPSAAQSSIGLPLFFAELNMVFIERNSDDETTTNEGAFV